MTDNTSTQSEPGTLRRFVACCRDMTEHDRVNARRANLWMFGWMLSFLGALLGMKYDLLPPGGLTYVAIAVATLLGLAAVLAYARFIREADELQRKMQTEALSLGFGGGFVTTFTLSLLERTEFYSADLGDPFLAMVVCYVLGLALAARRYA